jgi:hypothetical protein
MQEDGTYLDVKGFADSTLGEESAKLASSRERSEILPVRFLVGKEIWPSQVTRKTEEWLSRR